MIKFFRQFRLKFLSEQRFSKYLLYAIGEIALVVIGILIALGVNNWNEDKKNRVIEKEYLARIHNDLVLDTTQFRKIIKENLELREEIKDLLVTLYDGIDSIEQVQRIGATYDKALDQVFSPNDNTYKGMVSSGTLGLVQNLDLKEEIVNLYSEYDQKEALFSGIGQWMISVATAETIQTEFLKFNNGISDIFTTKEMLSEKDFAFLNDPEHPDFKIFVKAISATSFVQSASNGYYLELIGQCEIVLERIDHELH